MSNTLPFGPERFKECVDGKCKIYSLNSVRADSVVGSLVDHGFIADRACLWETSLDGHEFAVVARTYCSDQQIDHPPQGLKCIRLPKEILSPDEPGTPIAVVVTGNTPAAEALLSAFTAMPADLLAFAISQEMCHQGYAVLLKTGERVNFPVVKIVKCP
jgi:hypothetical protein